MHVRDEYDQPAPDVMPTETAQADAELSITIITSRGKSDFTFSKTVKIEEVIQKVRDHFELTGGEQFDLIRKGDEEELGRNRPLVSFGVKDGDQFILTGGGRNV